MYTLSWLQSALEYMLNLIRIKYHKLIPEIKDCLLIKKQHSL